MRVTRSLLLLVKFTALTAVAACGGSSDGGTEPPPAPPPPPAPITRLELAATKALMFTGSRHSARALVATAYDSTGAVVANPVLTLSAPAGWTVRGDTLVAPSSEQVATVRITATRPTTASATAAARVVGAAPLAATDSATDSVQVTAGLDLRAYNWRVRWSCYYRDGALVTNDGTPIDSTDSAVDITTISYREDSTFYWGFDTPTADGIAQFWPSGTLLQYRRDGVVDTIPNYPYPAITLRRQSPDTLWVYSPGWLNVDRNESPMPLVDSLPQRRYTGRNWCPNDGSLTTRTSVTTLETY